MPRVARLASVVAFAWGASGAEASARQVARVSVDSGGSEATAHSWASVITPDGRFVAFVSVASNLVSGDTNNVADFFVHDRASGATERVSVDSSGNEGNGRIDLDDGPLPGAISADGRLVAFASYATNLVANDTNNRVDVFVHDRQTGTTERVSVDSAGGEGNSASILPSLSADGRFVAFASSASDLVAGDTNGNADVFVHDRQTGSTERVSVDSAGKQANDLSGNPVISADGRIVAFMSFASNLVASDLNGAYDVFVRDRKSGTTERVSVDSAAGEANLDSWQPALNADGSVVAFLSSATNLVAADTNQKWDAFVRDRTQGKTERVSVDSAGSEAAGFSYWVALSADGATVAFENDAANLVAGDANHSSDVFLRYRAIGRTARVSVDSQGAEADLGATLPALSADGALVSFSSPATNLVGGDANACVDVFVQAGCTRAAWSNYGVGLAGSSGVPSIAPRDDPILGQPLTIDIGNSFGGPTFGLVLLGLQRAKLHTPFGGDVLLLPLLTKTISIPAGLGSYTGRLPPDFALSGLVVDLQAVEADPGALYGVSFTPGLELVLGH